MNINRNPPLVYHFTNSEQALSVVLYELLLFCDFFVASFEIFKRYSFVVAKTANMSVCSFNNLKEVSYI